MRVKIDGERGDGGRPESFNLEGPGIKIMSGESVIVQFGARALVHAILEVASTERNGEWAKKMLGSMARL